MNISTRFISLFFLLASLITSITVLGQTIRTFNVTSGNWNVASNWSSAAGSGIPTDNDEVIIPTGKTCINTTSITRNGPTTINGTLTNNSTINTSSNFSVTGGTLNNNSIISSTSTTQFFGIYGGIFNNNSGATFTHDDGQKSLLQIYGGGKINNAGTMTITSNIYGISGTIDNTGTFTNTGCISGTFTFKSSPYVNPVGSILGSSISTFFSSVFEIITLQNGLTNNGIIEFDLGSGSVGTPGADYDQIHVTGGTANLSGSFQANDWGVADGDVYTVLIGSYSGSFSNTTYNMGGGLTARVHYGSNVITISIETTLPIELASLKATPSVDGNILTWNTVSEVNTSHFDIERSKDGRIFNKINDIKTKGKAADYTYTDDKPIKGINYYRLKMVDLDGKTDYSKTVSVVYGKKSSVIIYPSVVRDELTIESTERIEIVSVLNAMGQVIFNSKDSKINVSGLTSGLYIVQAEVGGERFTQKILKE